MTSSCDICGRAVVWELDLPLTICRRARCKPEREFLMSDYTKRWEKRQAIVDRFKMKAAGDIDG